MSTLKLKPIEDPVPDNSGVAMNLARAASPYEAPHDGIAHALASPFQASEATEFRHLGRSKAPQAERPILTRTSGKDHADIANRIAQHLLHFCCMPDNIGPAWRMSFELAEGRISEEIARAFRLPITTHYASVLECLDMIQRAGLTRQKVKALLNVTDKDKRSFSAALQAVRS